MRDDEVGDLYRSYGGMVYRKCARLLGDKQEAFDVTQEVFMRGLRHRGTLRRGPELIGWLYVVATRLCLNRIRDRRTARDRSLTPSPITSPEAALLDRNLAASVLAGLDEATQAIAIYVHVDGMTHDEAARLAGVSPRTVRNRLARFLAHGRDRLGLLVREGHP